MAEKSNLANHGPRLWFSVMKKPGSRRVSLCSMFALIESHEDKFRLWYEAVPSSSHFLEKTIDQTMEFELSGA